MALRTQQVIAEESGAADVIDPLGGSWYVEALTDKIHLQAKTKIDEILDMGGALRGIESALQQKDIHEAAWQHMRAVEKNERLIIGVNHGVEKGNDTMTLQNLDLGLGERQKDKLSKLRQQRDEISASKALEEIRSGAKGTENMFPLIISAVKADCTLGEIMTAMKDVFGTYMAPSGF